METKVRDASGPPAGDTQSSAQAIQDLALQEGTNAHALRWRTKVWVAGWETDSFKDPGQGPGSRFQAAYFLRSSQLPPCKVGCSLPPQRFSGPFPGLREH